MSTGNAWLDSKPQDKVTAAIARFTESGGLPYANGHEAFGFWLALADTACAKRYGLSIFDLSDYMWRDAFDGGMSPYDAMREALADDDIGAMILAES